MEIEIIILSHLLVTVSFSQWQMTLAKAVLSGKIRLWERAVILYFNNIKPMR